MAYRTDFERKVREAGVTNGMIMDYAGVSGTSVKKWLNGKRKPHPKHFEPLKTALINKHSITITKSDFVLLQPAEVTPDTADETQHKIWRAECAESRCVIRDYGVAMAAMALIIVIAILRSAMHSCGIADICIVAVKIAYPMVLVERVIGRGHHISSVITAGTALAVALTGGWAVISLVIAIITSYAVVVASMHCLPVYDIGLAIRNWVSGRTISSTS